MSRDLSHFGRVINGQERSVQNSFEMFVQFHELLSITINSQPGQTKHTFLADSSSRGLSNQQNSFDTNDYAFMISPSLTRSAHFAMAMRYCQLWVWSVICIYFYLAIECCFHALKRRWTRQFIIYAHKWMLQASYLSPRLANKYRRTRKKTYRVAVIDAAARRLKNNISAYSFNSNVYFRTSPRLFPMLCCIKMPLST